VNKLLHYLLTIGILCTATGCASLFSDFTQKAYTVSIKPGARVIDVSTNDTLAVNQQSTAREFSLDLDTRRRHGIRIESDSVVLWSHVRPHYNPTALLNLFNHVFHPVDHLTGCDRHLESVGVFRTMRKDLTDSLIAVHDSLALSFAGLDWPRGLVGSKSQNRDSWVVAISMRYGFVGPITQAAIIGNSLNAMIGIRPMPWCEVGYDLVAFGNVGIGDLKDASGQIRSGYVMIREPIAGLTLRYGLGVSFVNGSRDVVTQADTWETQSVAGRFVVDTYGLGFSNQWISVEYRRSRFRDALIGGKRISSNNASIHFGFNLLL